MSKEKIQIPKGFRVKETISGNKILLSEERSIYSKKYFDRNFTIISQDQKENPKITALLIDFTEYESNGYNPGEEKVFKGSAVCRAVDKKKNYDRKTGERLACIRALRKEERAEEVENMAAARRSQKKQTYLKKCELDILQKKYPEPSKTEPKEKRAGAAKKRSTLKPKKKTNKAKKK